MAARPAIRPVFHPPAAQKSGRPKARPSDAAAIRHLFHIRNGLSKYRPRSLTPGGLAPTLRCRDGINIVTNTQLYLAIGVPFFSLLVVFLMNNRSIDALRSESKNGIDALRSEMREFDARFDRLDTRFDRMDARFDALERDLREFYGTQRHQDKAIERLEAGGK